MVYKKYLVKIMYIGGVFPGSTVVVYVPGRGQGEISSGAGCPRLLFFISCRIK